MPTLEQEKLKQAGSDEVDFLEVLKSEVGSQADDDEQVLVELSNIDHLQKIQECGEFKREDLEHLLTRGEKLAETVSFFAQENDKLRQFVHQKDEKIMASVDLITTQRDWVHNLLDDGVKLRAELEDVEAKKSLEIEALTERVNSILNEKEEVEEANKSLIEEKQNLLFKIESDERELRKFNGSLKKNQTQSLALQEQIISLEKHRAKDKNLVRLVGMIAALVSLIFVASIFRNNTSGTSGKINPSAENLTSIGNPADAPLLLGSTESNETFLGGVSESTSLDGDEVLVDVAQDEVLDDRIADKILADLKKAQSTSAKIAGETQIGSQSADSNSGVGSKTNKPKFTTYVVQPNDNLIKISRKFYGSDKYADELKKDNNVGRYLRVGATIKIAERIEEGE